MQFEILLQEPDGGDLLPSGVPAEANALAENTPTPGVRPATLGYAGDENAIDQGWGVIYPDGREDLLEAIAALIALRKAQIAERRAKRRRPGPPPPIPKWPVAPELTFGEFHRDLYERELPPLRPMYVLILGDLSEVSIHLQQGLTASGCHVGRLCFINDEGAHDLDAYTAYAAKVVKSESREASSDPTRLLFYSTQSERSPKPDALDNGYAQFISPMFDAAFDPMQELILDRSGSALLGPREAQGKDTWADLLAAARAPQPSVLLTQSHGAGRPAWDKAEQRAMQGRMKLSDTAMLDLADIGRGPFLPDGMWFYYACFGGGTPSESAQAAWMRKLVAARYWTIGKDVVGTLSKTEGGFIAKQPQVALANPDGPLAVFAHIDLAFVAAYKDYPGQNLHGAGAPADGDGSDDQRALRVLAVLKTLTEGKRAGLALSALARETRVLDQDLLDRYSEDATREAAVLELIKDQLARQPSPGSDTRLAPIFAAYSQLKQQVGLDSRVTIEALADAANMPPDRILAAFVQDQAEAARLARARLSRSLNWMAREDMRSFVLLGDPATRLPIAEQP